MNFIKMDNGTKKDSIISLIAAILVLPAVAAAYFWGSSLLALPPLLWLISVVEMLRGLHSDYPKLAKAARVILFPEAVLVLGVCVLTFVGTLNTVFGG